MFPTGEASGHKSKSGLLSFSPDWASAAAGGVCFIHRIVLRFLSQLLRSDFITLRSKKMGTKSSPDDDEEVLQLSEATIRRVKWSYKSLLERRGFKGEVRTINDRNICERRSCMKNNGKSPTLTFVSGEERRPSEVQRVSRNWRLPGATHSSAYLTWIRKWLKIQAPELSELESVGLELGSCCSDFDKLVSDEICRTRKRQFEIPFRLQAASCPRVTSCSIPPGRLSCKRRRADRKDFYHVPEHHKP